SLFLCSPRRRALASHDQSAHPTPDRPGLPTLCPGFLRGSRIVRLALGPPPHPPGGASADVLVLERGHASFGALRPDLRRPGDVPAPPLGSAGAPAARAALAYALDRRLGGAVPPGGE